MQDCTTSDEAQTQGVTMSASHLDQLRQLADAEDVVGAGLAAAVLALPLCHGAPGSIKLVGQAAALVRKRGLQPAGDDGKAADATSKSNALQARAHERYAAHEPFESKATARMEQSRYRHHADSRCHHADSSS